MARWQGNINLRSAKDIYKEFDSMSRRDPDYVNCLERLVDALGAEILDLKKQVREQRVKIVEILKKREALR